MPIRKRIEADLASVEPDLASIEPDLASAGLLPPSVIFSSDVGLDPVPVMFAIDPGLDPFPAAVVPTSDPCLEMAFPGSVILECDPGLAAFPMSDALSGREPTSF
mmetsp:Transcript_18583/g.30562  ORF Transcript_18583/g.30562 Transcript_18583/m.30562 type:complete len:105 (-) Transcript_18583:259-573(-)|eukprot:CAMPEP_0184673620 /NCGR_PEP_ID=MMETSP0308-20130426/86779_1 /TAXON_ID=38269 /ORGANISM="Gloeochaete witrockiana, Strain SAG 46.84" /LENGTH=104 /DNA_ID=CAMNT_0027121125 /DNA_START=476 /DNA_END=790 /DNA_ORIENTATION=+